MLTMYPSKVNSPKTSIVGAIGASDVTITIADASYLPDAPNLAVIGEGDACETILYTVKTGAVLSGITRGFQGTAQGWDDETPIARNMTAYDHATFAANIAELEARFSAGQYIIYVGKDGSDANAGTRMFAPKLTLAAAITAASALVTAGAARAAVLCSDAGTYTENLTIPAAVSLFAQNATIIGEHTVTGGCVVDVFRLMPGADSDVVITNSGAGISFVRAQIWDGRGASGSLINTVLAYNAVSDGVIYIHGYTMYVAAGGWGCIDNAADNGHIHIDTGDLYLMGANSVGIEAQGVTSHIVAIAQHIIAPGLPSGSVGVKSSNTSARIEITANEIKAETASSASTGTVRMNVCALSGSIVGTNTYIVVPHASSHATGALDALDPSAIGAAELDANGKVLATQATARIQTKSGNYTLVASDNASRILFTAAATLTVAPDLPVGFECEAVQDSAGQITVAAGSGVTLKSTDNKYLSAKENAVIGIAINGTNIAHISGERA